MRIKIKALILLLSVITACFCSCMEGKDREQYTQTYFEYFDTVTSIIGYAGSREEFDGVCALIESELEEYHKLYDIYHSYSGINNLRTVNESAGIAPIAVDEKIISLLEFCKNIYSQTEGSVNCAMGSVLEIWHEHRTNYQSENATVPAMAELTAVSEHCEIDKIIIDREKGEVYLADKDMSLDVGAVGKGFAVEKIAKMLIEKGIDGYTVNVGGNVRTIGNKGDGEKWIAGIQNPSSDNMADYAVKVAISDCSLVTSGTYQRYYTVDGVDYSHIIDPKTLMPADYYSSVSVIASDSGFADAMSTALFNLPYQEGIAAVEAIDGVEAMWINKSGEIFFSSGFEKFVVE